MSTSLDPGGGPPRRGAGPRTDLWSDVQESSDFQDLRRRVRNFIFPATVAFLAWYLLYVLLSAYARGFMAEKVLGNINVAYLFGLLQFLSTFLIALVYARYMGRKADPLSDALRAEIEPQMEPRLPR